MKKIDGLYKVMMSTIFSQIMIRTFDQALCHCASNYKDLSVLRSKIDFIPGVMILSDDNKEEYLFSSIGPFDIYHRDEKWLIVASRPFAPSSFENQNKYYDMDGIPIYQSMFTVTEEQIYPNDTFLEFIFKYIGFKYLDAIELISDRIHGEKTEKDPRYNVTCINFTYFLSKGINYLLGAIQGYLHENYKNGADCNEYLYLSENIDGYKKLSQLITSSRMKYEWIDFQYILINPFDDSIYEGKGGRLRMHNHSATIDMSLIEDPDGTVNFDSIIECWSEILSKRFIIDLYEAGVENIKCKEATEMLNHVGDDIISLAYMPVYNTIVKELRLRCAR